MAFRETLRRRWWQVAIGAVAAVGLLLTVGVYVFLHVIEGTPAKPLSLSDVGTSTTRPSTSGSSTSGATSSSTTGVASGAGVDGAWKVTSNGTEVGYRVKETLFGQSTTAIGRTSAVTGSMTISGSTVNTATFSVDMTQVSSDRSGRDDQFQGRIMDTADFPTATFALTTPIDFGALPPLDAQISAKATGKLTLHGTTKDVSFTVNAKRTASGIAVQGQIPITFADYNINNPSGGPASVGNSGTMEFLLVLVRS